MSFLQTEAAEVESQRYREQHEAQRPDGLDSSSRTGRRISLTNRDESAASVVKSDSLLSLLSIKSVFLNSRFHKI